MEFAFLLAQHRPLIQIRVSVSDMMHATGCADSHRGVVVPLFSVVRGSMDQLSSKRERLIPRVYTDGFALELATKLGAGIFGDDGEEY